MYEILEPLKCSGDMCAWKETRQFSRTNGYYSLIGSGIRLQAGRPRNRDSIPRREEIFLLSQSVQITSRDQAVLYSTGNWNSILASKAAGLEADYSLSSCVEIKNAWSCISNPHMRPDMYSRNSSCTADVTIHETVLISPQNRFTEKVFTD